MAFIKLSFMSSSSQHAQVIFIDNEIRPESEWDIDSEACGLCEKQFSMIGRRHHCRSCGLCACDTCAPYTIALTKNKIETCRIRICTVCSLSSLAVSPLSRISNPATPLVKGSAGSRLQEVSIGSCNRSAPLYHKVTFSNISLSLSPLSSLH